MQSEKIFKKILIPVDGSIPSLIAQELTAFVAKKLGSRVTVIHVVSHEFMHPQTQKLLIERHAHVPIGPTTLSPPATLHSAGPPAKPFSDAVSEEIINWVHQKGEKAVADAVALFKEENVPVDSKLVEYADPAETILNEAEKGGYELIVLARSGEEEQEAHLGNIAEKVTRHSEAPVLIVGGKRKLSKILVPIDGSENAEKALRHAIFLAKSADVKLTLLYVQESSLFDLKPELTKEVGTRILSDAANKAKGLKVGQKLKSGNPAKVITKMANKEDYDLVVMGSRGLGTIGRFLLGSVSDHVAHYANRSVLIIK